MIPLHSQPEPMFQPALQPRCCEQVVIVLVQASAVPEEREQR